MTFITFRLTSNLKSSSFLCRNSLTCIYRNLNSVNLKSSSHQNVSFSSFKSNSNPSSQSIRNFSKDDREFLKKLEESRKRSKDMALYGITVVLLSLALSYAAVPIYRIYCQATGKGGKPKIADDFLANKVKKMQKQDRIINVLFQADKEAKMRWNFKPTQDEIKVHPGETALAFFTAKNPTTLPVNGVSTYSVAPVEAGKYLNKVQCFCFEEQRLDPGEEVDMPVFFYFDSEFADDPRLTNVDEVALSYTFFEAKEGFKIPTFPSIFKPGSTEPTPQLA